MTAAGLDTRPAVRTAGRDLRMALPPLILALAAFAFVFQAEIAAAVRVWIDSRAYNHGFLVLPIALWLAWDRRRRARGLALRPTLWPLLAVVPLGFGWFVADRLGIMEGRQLAALFMLQALLVAWLGWRPGRAPSPRRSPTCIFLVPFGAFITPALQVFTARFIDVGLAVIGIPHVVTDFTIEIPEGTFYVAEACAGLRFLIASIAFGALYALLIYRSAGPAARVHAGLDRGADHRQRVPRARHRGARPCAGQRRGGGGGPPDLWLGVLLRRDAAADRGRAAVPAGHADAASRRPRRPPRNGRRGKPLRQQTPGRRRCWRRCSRRQGRRPRRC